MSVLAGLFGSAPDQSHDSEKLLHLYWNRAELKKEFAGLRKEQFRLRDLVKQQEGATARLQQKLEHLENLLIDPEWASNAVTFYQLRGLALRCERKLARFAEQLKQQREQKQHNQLLVSWNDERMRERRIIERKLAGVRETVTELGAALKAEKAKLVRMKGFLKVFRRRTVTAILEKTSNQIAELQQQELELLDKLQQLKDRRPPENHGLDIATKRSINFMIISYAQQLFLHFGDSDFAALAKEANDKSVGGIKYGNDTDCQHLLRRIQKHVAIMDRSNDVAAVLQKRSQLIGEKAVFRSDDDAVPVATSVAAVFSFGSDASITESKANILGENYWGIAKYLSR
ncbi:hypothetical protein [Woeseia oceani]|uniref:hypothetical protein n=1 Tax=Woeseia oceani TaxID=1548547 RepID=UPI000B2F3810|nr:hypothetical protein [Woeseia oceani]